MGRDSHWKQNMSSELSPRRSGLVDRAEEPRDAEGVHVSRHGHTSEDLTHTIQQALERAGVDPTRTERVLNDVVDLDALAELCAPKASGTARGGGTVIFEYCGATVTVTPETVAVQPSETSPNSADTWRASV